MLQKVQVERNALQEMSKILKRTLVVFLFLFSFHSYGQHQVGITVGYHKLGIIQGVEYEYMHHRWGFPFEMDFNSVRLFQQRKFQFRLIGGVNYAIIKKENLRFKANLTYGITNLPVSKNQNKYWDEILVGPSIEIGKKWKFVTRAKVGWIQQRFRNVVTRKWITASEFGYSFKIGLLYEI